MSETNTSIENVLRVYYHDTTNNNTYTNICIAKTVSVPDVYKSGITLESGLSFSSMTIDELRKRCTLARGGISHTFDTRIVQVIAMKV